VTPQPPQTELRRTPLHQEHLALSARMVDFCGWAMPVQYSGIIDEHNAVRTGVGIFDICHMSEYRICGPGAKSAIDHLVTNDLDRIDTLDTALYTVMCDEAAGIIDDLIIYHTGDHEYLIIANAATHDADWAWITSHLPDDVEAVDESDRTGLIAVQGPDALRIIESLSARDWQAPSRFAITEGILEGVPVLIARTGYTGEDGVEVLCRASDTAALWRLLLSFPEVTPCGLGARDTLRLEMGYALYGTDMSREIDPISAGLGWVAPAAKTGHIGADAIARMRAEGPATVLAGLTVTDGVPRHGCPLLHAAEPVGNVASGTFSPTLGHGIATAYVPVDLAAEGTVLDVEIRRRTVPARVTKPPFVKETSLSAIRP